jgi:hypothetical protein
LQPCGTADEIAAKLIDDVTRVDAAGVIVVSSYGGMPEPLARANQERFARDVMPTLHAHDTDAEVGLSGLHAHA